MSLLRHHQLLMSAVAASSGPFFNQSYVLSTDWDRAYNNSAIYDSVAGKTYVAWQTAAPNGLPSKGVRISAFDHSLKTWSKPITAGNFVLANDAHGVPTLAIDDDGYVYCFFGSHNSVQQWSISSAPNDISEWTQQSAISGVNSYPHAEVVGGTMYLFMRDSTSVGQQPLILRTASPSSGSATFGAASDVVDFGSDTRFYMGESHVVGTDIHIISTLANSSDTYRRGVYYFVYDTTDGSVRNFAGDVVVTSGSLPVGLTTANASFRLYDQGVNDGGIPSLNFDGSGNPHIIFTETNGSGYDLKHIYHNGSVWTTQETIALLDDIAAGGYDSTYSIVPHGSGMAAFYENSGDIDRRVFSGGSWGAASTAVSSDTGDLLYNSYVKNSIAEMRLVISEYAPWTTDADATKKALYACGDSGLTAGSVAPVDMPNWTDVVLLTGFQSRDGAVSTIDESSLNIKYAGFHGAAEIDDAQSKFGGKSLKLAGSGWVTYPNSSVFSMNSGDFTAEAWIYLNSTSGQQVIFSKRPLSGQQEWQFQTVDGGGLALVAWPNSSTPLFLLSGSGTVSAGVWTHVAFSREGSNVRMFLNGALDGSVVQSGTVAASSTGLIIGRDGSTSNKYLNGWVDEVRISNRACYTASFTPPAAPFSRGF